MKRKLFVFHSALAPAALAETLRRSVDKEQWTLFLFSGYRGENALIGDVDQDCFRLRKRPSIFTRNDFARQFYARVIEERGGSRIEGYFEVSRWTKWFMRLWLAGVIVIGTPIFVMSLLDLAKGTNYMIGDNWVGLIVPPALVAWGFVLPWIGRLFGLSSERFILEFVQNTLAAQIKSV